MDGAYPDYTENLLYKVNFKDLLNSTNDKVTKVGSGITVDSTNTYATIDGASGIKVDASIVDPESKLKGTTSKTLTYWYRKSESPKKELIACFGKDPNPLEDSGYGCGLLFNTSSSIFATTGNDVTNRYASHETGFDGNWHFLVGVWENNTEKLFYDNVRLSKSVNYNTLNSILFIGYYNNKGSNAYHLKGDLADVRIYSSALTDDNVYQLYKYGKYMLENK